MPGKWVSRAARDGGGGGIRTVDGRCARRQHGRDEDVPADQPLSVDGEQFGFVWELVEQGPDGRKSRDGGVGEERVLYRTRWLDVVWLPTRPTQ